MDGEVKDRNGKKRQGWGQGWEAYEIEGACVGKEPERERERVREEKEKPAQVTLCKSVPI